jgi:hypothetical protein
VPVDLDALVDTNGIVLTHTIESRQAAWIALADPTIGDRERDTLSLRVSRLTADLAALWPERRRLVMLLSLRSRTHESYLTA